MIDNIPKYIQNACVHQNSNAGNLEILLGAQLMQPVFIRSNLFLYQKRSNMFPSFILSSLTICQCNVEFSNINFRCKIQVSGKSKIIATNCTFTSFDKSCEAAIEIFEGASGEFTNCRFYGGYKTAVAIRDCAEANFTNCVFEDNLNSSLLVLNKSRANIKKCQFKTATHFSLYLFKNSVAKIEDTIFVAQNGKAIFMLYGSQAHIFKSSFDGCIGGGISIAESCDVFIDQCSFKNLGNTAIHSINNSNVEIKRCFFCNCKGNGANFACSTGYIYKSIFQNFDFPAIACYGPKTALVVYDTKITNCNSFAVVSRDCANPLFSKMRISNVKSNCFSISDFSSPVIENCFISNIQKSFFSAFNGATPTIKNCHIIQKKSSNIQPLFNVFTEGNIVFKNNNIISEKGENIFITVKNNGKIQKNEFVSNYLYAFDNQIVNKNLLSIDESNNIILNEVNSSDNQIDIFENYQKYEHENDDNDEKILEDEEPTIYQNEHDNKLNQNISEYQFNHMSKLKRNPKIAKPEDLPEPLKEMDVEDFMKSKYKHYDESNNNQNNHHCEHDCHHHQKCCELCMKCKKNRADHVIVPCGHKVLCKECAEQYKSKAASLGMTNLPIQHFCPLCDLPIRCCTEEYSEDICSICLENKADTIILPCGHRCICYECATHLWNEKKQCPLCQTRLLTFKHQFQIFPENVT